MQSAAITVMVCGAGPILSQGRGFSCGVGPARISNSKGEVDIVDVVEG